MNHQYWPFRDGLLIGVGHPDNRIYLFRRVGDDYAAPEVIFQGASVSPAVSPDGCRLALVTGVKAAPGETPSHLEIIDLCLRN